LNGLSDVQDLGFTPDRIKATLKDLVARAKKEIQPLMGVGAHYGYFTCVDLKGIYPSEDAARESLELQ
jgi:hypothetical protein